MTATLKTTIIQEPSSATANMTLDTSGGVTVGQNIAVTGTTTFTGGVVSAGLPLKGSSSGTTTLVASATASGTVTLPAGTGTAVINGLSSSLVQGTAVASTSGTNIDFTSIPSWVKRITVMFNGVSTNGTADINVQLGTGSTPTYTTSGYLGSVSSQTGSTVANFTSGFTVINSMAAASIFHGNIIICNITGNTWSESGLLGNSSAAGIRTSGGSIPLGAVLTAIRITTTDTFDAGSINILYE